MRFTKPGTPKSHTSLKVSYTNIRGFCSNFLRCESYLETNLPDILALSKTNLDDVVDSNSFIVEGYIPLICNDSSTHMHDLGVFVKEGLPLGQEISLETFGDSYMCFRLALLHSVSYFFFLYRSPSSPSCSALDGVCTNIDRALSKHPTANVFVFCDFNVHHVEWLKHSCGTDQPGEYSFNFSITHDITQIVDFPTCIPDSDTHRPALLDLFLTSRSWAMLCGAFAPLGNSDHVVVSVSVDFVAVSEKDVPYYHKAFDYGRAD